MARRHRALRLSGGYMSTKGTKHDGGKIPLNLLSNYALEEVAKVLDFGAKKYRRWDWSEGIAYSRVIAAAKRHIAQWEDRTNLDPETGISHLAHALCNLMFLLDYEIRDLKEFDDRRPEHTLKKKAP